MQEKEFINYLSKIKKEDLIGFEAHKKMIPFKTNPNIREFTPKDDSKESSVLILLSETEKNNLDITFTLRSSKLRKHSGQISFPGGRKENGETHIDTALRECEEEINLNVNDIKVITELSQLFVPPSNNIVYPIIAYSNKKLNLKANPDEVDEIIPINFKHFLNESNKKYSRNLYPNQLTEFPYWDINHKTPLWGATAIMLQELLDIWEKFKSNN